LPGRHIRGKALPINSGRLTDSSRTQIAALLYCVAGRPGLLWGSTMGLGAMEYQLNIRKSNAYLHVCVAGLRTRQTVAAVAKEILTACVDHEADKVLVDVRGLEGRLSIFDARSIPVDDFPEIRQAGVITKAVIVDTEERKWRHHFFEAIARRHGYNIRIFRDFDSAVMWLCANENVTT